MNTGLKLQLTINTICWLLEYLEMLNVYNCNQYWCFGSHFILLNISLISYINYRYDKLIFIPSFVNGLIGTLSLLFSSITWWNTHGRHRSEYYDSHSFYHTILYINLFWNLLYLLVLKEHIENVKKILILFGVSDLDMENLNSI